MEFLCQILFCGLELFRQWVDWSRQIMNCCFELLKPDGYFWEIIKDFIFPERYLTLPCTPVSTQRLQPDDIYSLFMDIINEYIPRARRYVKDSEKNCKLWQILFLFLGVMFLGASLLITICIYYTRNRLKEKIDYFYEIFRPEKRMQAAAKRSLLIAREELNRLKVNYLVQCEEVLTYDGTSTLMLKVASKLQLFDNIVTKKTRIIGRLYRLQDQQLKSTHDFKTQIINIALRFLGKYPRKLHLLVVFEERIHENKSIRRCSRQKKNHVNFLAVTKTYRIYEFYPKTGSGVV
uniref:Uncharacterized protein n=1 Tax=Glossina brevipalpis TaxID=37001 RepID=A0A1A9W1F5_9MUSC